MAPRAGLRVGRRGHAGVAERHAARARAAACRATCAEREPACRAARESAGESARAGLSRAARLGRLAARALVLEARATPKPGLVDSSGRGSHADMDLSTFLASSAAIAPFFESMAAAGKAWAAGESRADGDSWRLGRPPREALPREPASLLASLRPLGIAAEAAMYAATGGVNTHKGAIFSLGLLAGAAGALAAAEAGVWAAAWAGPESGAWAAAQAGAGNSPARARSPGAGLSPDAERSLPAARSADLAERICALAAAACLGVVERELEGLGRSGFSEGLGGTLRPATAGERLYAATGSGGARAEAQAGYPSVRLAGLPALRRARAAGAGPEAQAVTALLALMARVEDSCVYSRAGQSGLALVRSRSASLGAAIEAAGFAEGRFRPREYRAILDFGRELEAVRASPGGSADLLAATLFLDSVEREGRE